MFEVPQVDYFWCQQFQDFKFRSDTKYDCIWIQWLFMYLRDDEIIKILTNCKNSLSLDENGKTGLIFVKDNINSGEGICVDEHSFRRTVGHYEAIFSAAGYDVLHSSKQTPWNEELSGTYSEL